MKKWRISLGKFCLAILLLAPVLGYQFGVSAEPTSLLSGKIVTPGKNARAPLTSTNFVTDNNDSTYYGVKPEQVSSTATDFLIYTFDTPQNITSFKLYVKDFTNQKFQIGFIDNNGHEVGFQYADGSTGGDDAIHKLPNIVENVKTAYVWNYSSSAQVLNVLEWGLYNDNIVEATPTPTVAPTTTPTEEPATPEPTPTITPSPEPPIGHRAILVVTLDNGLEKEFDLNMTEVNAFIDWYENKQAGTGSATYAINKHDNNKGPFTSRKDYVIFGKILTFSVDEYSL